MIKQADEDFFKDTRNALRRLSELKQDKPVPRASLGKRHSPSLGEHVVKRPSTGVPDEVLPQVKDHMS